MSDLRPERDVRKEIADEEKTVDEDRDYAEWVEEIGPEEMDRKIVVENLEDYGWEVMGEDNWVSEPTMESDMPDWLEDDDEDEPEPRERKALLEEQLLSGEIPRPVEDVVIDELDGDEPDEEEEES